MYSTSSHNLTDQFHSSASIKSKCSNAAPKVTSVHSKYSNEIEDLSKANQFLKECNMHFSSMNSKSSCCCCHSSNYPVDHDENKSDESILTQKPSNDFREDLNNSKTEKERPSELMQKSRKSEGNTFNLTEKSYHKDSLSITDKENDLISLTLSISETVENK